MALTVKKISLDFYINNIVTINAKQLDTESRYINVTCTDHGKKVTLSSDNVSVFVRYKKSDGNDVFNDGVILEDGTVNMLLTQQMLAASGRQKVDIIILATSGLKVDDLATADSFYDLGVTIISTMTFYINVVPTAVEHSRISSTSEFDALMNGVARLAATERQMEELEDSLESAESARVSAENSRVSAEKARSSAESSRKTAESSRVSAETARNNAEAARELAEQQRQTNTSDAIAACNTATTNANTATENANTAAVAANEAAELCQSVIDKSGIVLQTEKSVANGIATLDENAKVPYEQLNVANDLTTETTGKFLDAHQGKVLKDLLDEKINEINTTLANLPVIHSGAEVPDNSIGKDGDIYMQIIG